MTSANESEKFIFMFLTIISIIGTVGNSIVAFVYWRKKDKQTSTFFVLVLSLSDLIICFLLLPITIYMEKIQFLTDNIFFCKLFFFLTTTIVPSSSLLMLALAFDRYFCICMIDKNIINLHRARVVALVLLLFGMFCGVIPGWMAELRLVINENIFLTNESNSTPTHKNTTNDIYHFKKNQCLIDDRFNIVQYFKNFYDLIYFFSVILITILYAVIFKEIYMRRKLKNSRKRELLLKIVMSKSKNRSYSQSFVSNKEFVELSRGIQANNLNKKKTHPNKNKLKFLTRFCSIFFKKNNQKESSIEMEKLKVVELKKALNNLQINYLSNDSISTPSSQAPDKKFQIINENQSSSARLDMSHELRNNSQISLSKKSTQKSRLSLKAISQRSSIRTSSKQINFESEKRIDSNAIPFLILIKDTRIASMLFVVSIVFVATYLPSILATRSILPNDNLYIVYLYFTNSAANPFINLFINRSFRYDLFRLLKRSKPSFSNVFSK